ncbi:hypothetical protein SEA_KEELAN_137 [Gordonia phage Keelan]|nr:hypothetical protein SEA_KEELAN_137 [Gordonia phage Keelan]
MLIVACEMCKRPMSYDEGFGLECYESPYEPFVLVCSRKCLKDLVNSDAL